MTIFSSKSILFLFLISGILSAHEQWLFCDQAIYSPGDTVIVHLQSGHTAGISDYLIQQKLIQEVLLYRPQGQQVPFELTPNMLEYTGKFLADSTGIWTVRVHLRKRQQGPWVYLLQLRIEVGQQTKEPTPLPAEQLEIQADNAYHTFHVLAKGESVLVPVNLWSSFESTPSALSMDRHGVSTVEQLVSGFHVAVCHFRRQTTSYAFHSGD